MRCSPWRWFLGVIPIVIMSWLAVLGHHPNIERDLAERTNAALGQSGNTWAKVQFTGRDGVLTGKTADEDAAAKAITAAKATWGVREVENRSALVEKADKYVWRARRKADRVLIDGYVPNDAARKAIVDIARSTLPGVSVDESLDIARGAPRYEEWIAGITFALQQLSRLAEGQVELEQTELSIQGTARDAQAHANLSSAAPAGIRVKSVDVRPPIVKPYVWSARSNGEQIALSGYLPDETARNALVGAAAGKRLDDRTAYGSGEPRGFPAAAFTALSVLTRLEEGSIEIRDSDLTFIGIAADKTRADNARTSLKSVPAPFKVSEQIAHRVPTITPYVTSAHFERGGVLLSGHAPTEAAKAALAAAVKTRMPDRDVHNTLEIGLGEAPAWQRCFELGLDALRQLGNGMSVLTGRRLEVSGEAPSERVMQELTEALRDSAGRDCDTATRISSSPPPPPQPPAVDPAEVARARAAEAAAAAETQRRLAEAEVQQKRQAAEEAAYRKAEEAKQKRQAAEEEKRRQAEEAANRKAEEAKQKATSARQKAEDAAREKAVVAAERQKRADEEAARKTAAATAAAEQQQRQREQEALSQRAAAAAAADAEIKRRQEIAAACQDKLRTTVREGVIHFDYAKFHITESSHATLDRVAEAINTCPDFSVEIGGHTDTDGAPDRNERLSERRAKAVLEYLVEAGVPANRLRAVGYGENRAVAPNDTPENKAKNRRIEFSVTSP